MKKNTTSENNEFAAVDVALKRAAKVAHTFARKTKTPCYIWEGGKIVNVTDQKKTKKAVQN